MSEADSRPAATRGRASTRGGRGGFGRGGPRGSKRINGTSTSDSQVLEEDLENQGELGDMKRQYAGELPLLKDMFADWTDVDLLFALRECDGDLPATVDRITQGNVSQFSEVKKNKDRARSRVKDETPPVAATEKTAGTIRGGRGRGGLESSRGRGGRGGERGRGAHRGGRGGHATTNGTSKDHDGASVPTTESSAWNAGANEATTASWDTSAPSQAAVTPSDEQAAVPSAKKTWASMFSQPVAAQKPSVQSQSELGKHQACAEVVPGEILTEETQPAILAAAIIDHSTATQEAQLPPPKNPLTQENVEHLPDESHPPATHTAASTVDSNDPRNLTPLPGQQAPIGRPPLGGFAASAQRATSSGLRTASFQRRVQEQQEALVMPTHSAVDRAAVQFGSMGLNGTPGLDVDDEREDPETRQAPQHSPPSQPKASLPPSARQTATAAPIADASLTKQAPGLPPASQNNQPPLHQDSALSQGLQQDHSQLGYGQSQGQFAGYGQAPQHDAQAAQSKQYDPFSSQAQSQYDRFSQQIQAPPQSQQSHQGFGGLPTSQHDYSSYYGSEQHRNAYNQYYGGSSYGAQDNRGQQDSLGQRNASGYGTGLTDASYGAQSQQQSRYNEGTSSGNITPNPPLGGQQQHQQQQQQQQQQLSQQSGHSMHPQGQSHQQQPSGFNASGFPYGHPYFNSPYAQAYQNQFGFSQYGGGYSNKGSNMYGAPQGYVQSPYEQQSSSPANSNAFSQNQSSVRSGTAASTGFGGSSLDEYGRNTQATSQAGASAYLNSNDPFARGSSAFGQGYAGQTSSAGAEDSLKPFADPKTGSSPALAQPGRPGSAANSANVAQPGQQQVPGQQSNFAGYQNYPAQNNQYGNLGGLGSHPGQSQQAQYGGYGASGFSQYGSYNSRGGWGQSYGTH